MHSKKKNHPLQIINLINVKIFSNFCTIFVTLLVRCTSAFLVCHKSCWNEIVSWSLQWEVICPLQLELARLVCMVVAHRQSINGSSHAPLYDGRMYCCEYPSNSNSTIPSFTRIRYYPTWIDPLEFSLSSFLQIHPVGSPFKSKQLISLFPCINTGPFSLQSMVGWTLIGEKFGMVHRIFFFYALGTCFEWLFWIHDNVGHSLFIN